MGHYVRNTHETCLICVRGKGASSARLSKSIPSVLRARKPPEHSAKPPEFYDLVERLFPGPYVRLFARSHRPLWTSYGDEVERSAAE